MSGPRAARRQPIRRWRERAPEPGVVRREEVNPPVTLGSGSGHNQIKADILNASTHTQTTHKKTSDPSLSRSS